MTSGPLLSLHTHVFLCLRPGHLVQKHHPMCQVGPCPGPFLSQAPETNTGSTASVKPAQEEQSTTPPGKVVTVSSRSPRCPRNQAALRHSKAFSPSSVPCSSGEARLATAVLGLQGPGGSTVLGTGWWMACGYRTHHRLMGRGRAGPSTKALGHWVWELTGDVGDPDQFVHLGGPAF